MQGIVEEPKVVVGLDFGTSFSGFAYAHRADPDKIYTFYDWPKQAEGGGLPYCKTRTSLLYVNASPGSLELRKWGWPAYVEFKSPSIPEPDYSTPQLDFEVVNDFEVDTVSPPDSPHPAHSEPSSTGSYFLSHFKLHLASKDAAYMAPSLPQGLSVKRVITDFLAQIAVFILKELRNKFGSHISLDDIQWCLTVPAIWDDEAKQAMRDCAEMAGLVQGPMSNGNDAGSPHRMKLFSEPEAASVYCQGFFTNDKLLRQGSKFLVVDCGGGTVDLVLHEKLGAAPSLSVKEVQQSSGDICGGSKVDEEFSRFLRSKISCYKRFERQHPATVLEFLKAWETIKYRFNGTNGKEQVELPPKLAEMWEMEEGKACESDYLKLSDNDIKSMFDPVVTRILELIEEKMVPDLTAIMVVGGFSESPYLMKRIRDTFGDRVGSIQSPPAPGTAVCQGAVTLGIRSDIVVSRISKLTYGVRVARPFIAGVHSDYFKVEGKSGQLYCNNIFGVFVKKGDEVRFDECVQNVYFPTSETQDALQIELFSSNCRNVKFISDPGSKTVGTFRVKIPTQEELGFMPKVEVSMCFGRSEIQVTAVGKNFGGGEEKTSTLTLPVKFEASGIF